MFPSPVPGLWSGERYPVGSKKPMRLVKSSEDKEEAQNDLIKLVHVTQYPKNVQC